MHTRDVDIRRITEQDVRASGERTFRLRAARRRPLPARRVLMMPADGWPDLGVLPCEPVWTPFRGRRDDASPSDVFVGALSGGASALAEVLVTDTWTLRELHEPLARSMCTACFDRAAAALEARRLTTAVQRFPDGTLLRIGPDGTLMPVGRRTEAERATLLR